MNLVLARAVVLARESVVGCGRPHQADRWSHTPLALRIHGLNSAGSTSGADAVPFFGNIDSTSAQVVRQRRMLNDEQTRIARMMPSTNGALLSSIGG